MTFLKKTFLSVLLLYAIQGCSTEHKSIPDPTIAITIPLYIYPTTLDVHTGSSYWEEVIEAADEVPITAIINPNNGDHGIAPDPNFIRGIEKLKDHDITTLGYTYTQYAQRDSAQVIASIDFYHKFYHVDGIFFDEANSSHQALAYYQRLRSSMTPFEQLRQDMINPGVIPAKAFIDTSSPRHSIVVFEGTQAQFMDTPFDLSQSGHDKDAFICLVHDTPASKMPETVDIAIERSCGHIFVTDDKGNNPWDTLPVYWDALVDYVADKNLKK